MNDSPATMGNILERKSTRQTNSKYKNVVKKVHQSIKQIVIAFKEARLSNIDSEGEFVLLTTPIYDTFGSDYFEIMRGIINNEISKGIKDLNTHNWDVYNFGYEFDMFKDNFDVFMNYIHHHPPPIPNMGFDKQQRNVDGDDKDAPESKSYLDTQKEVDDILQNLQNVPNENIDDVVCSIPKGRKLYNSLEFLDQAIDQFYEAYGAFDFHMTSAMAKKSKIIQKAEKVNDMLGNGFLNLPPFNKITTPKFNELSPPAQIAKQAPAQIMIRPPARIMQQAPVRTMKQASLRITRQPKAGYVNRRRPWNQEEDRKILDYVEENGSGNFFPLTKTLKRPLKEIRERWKNHLSPLNIKEWKPEDDDLLIALFRKLGPDWTLMSKIFKDKSNIDCKNRWENKLKYKTTS